jgi:hypothetical protein
VPRLLLQKVLEMSVELEVMEEQLLVVEFWVTIFSVQLQQYKI